jgi:hypothetical protein
MQNAIPILSLIVAILAVFVGPLISWQITKRQMLTSLKKGKEGEEIFTAAHPKVLALSRSILKREWDRVKEDIPLT